MTQQPNKPHFLVLGAGVTGLTTAYSLLRSLDCKLTILSAHTGRDVQNIGDGVCIEANKGSVTVEGGYCSSWAGAHWRPVGETEELIVCYCLPK